MRKMKKLFFVFVFLLASASLMAQSQKQFIRKGDTYFRKGRFYNAIECYELALNFDSSAVDLNYQYAEACRFVNNYATSERYYQKVWMRDSKSVYPQSQYWLGMMQKANAHYKDAEKTFDRYLRRFARDSSNYFTKRAGEEKIACAWAQKQLTEPSRTQIFHLDSSINSVHAEFGTAIEDTFGFYFTSLRSDSLMTVYQRDAYSRLYYSKGKDTLLQHGFLKDTMLLDMRANIGNPSLSVDLKTLYFTVSGAAKPRKLPDGIYCCTLENGKATATQRLDTLINKAGCVNTHPFIAPDSMGVETLFFASDRPGGYGKLDIWFAKKEKSGSFATAINAGAGVNSVDDEVTPYLNAVQRRLYFSSNGFRGMGLLDVFASSWSDSLRRFGPATNLGYPINSPVNDLYYTLGTDTAKGYLSSNRKGSLSLKGYSCCSDLYYLETPPAPVDRTKSDTLESMPVLTSAMPVERTEDPVEKIKLLVPLTLYFNNDEPDPKTLSTTTSKTYEETYRSYLTFLPKYKSEYAKGLKDEEKQRAEGDIERFFDQQLKHGFEDLEKFAALTLENVENGKVVRITTRGYCSPLASTDYNKNLAHRRTASLTNYFMTYGNGIFLEYMSELPPPAGSKKGRIVFEELSVGETEDAGVSDNYQDQRNSVYSRKAMLERKIQIIAVSAKE